MTRTIKREIMHAMTISAFDSIEEINSTLAACKQAIKDIMLGKRSTFNGREWVGEDLDKLQNMLVWLGNEREKFTASGSGNRCKPVHVSTRPVR